MLAAATRSSGSTLSDTIVGLVYLAAVVTAVVVVARRLLANRRGRRHPPSTPAQDVWERLLAPLGLPGWAAPSRPAAGPARDRVGATQPAQARSAELPSPSVIDLRGPMPSDSGTERAAPVSPVVGPREPGGQDVVTTTAPNRTFATTRCALAEPYVAVLGPVELGCAVQPDRRIVKELAVYLALHRDRPRSAEELVEALWPPRDDLLARERDPDAVHQTASRLRRCLGPDALPDATATGGYLMSSGVECDWDVFRSLLAEVRTTDNPAGKLSDALALVAGPPFSGIKADSYGWVFTELWASKMTAAIVETAHDLVERALAVNDDATAEWAAGQGLLASPAEEMLHEDRLRIAAATRDSARFERAWTDVRGVLGEQADAGPVGTTYRRLR